MILCEKMGIMVHPCFKKLQDEKEQNFILIQNMKIDFANIKIGAYAWKFSKMECLKLNNNALSKEEFTAMKSFIFDSKVKVLFFDYNEVEDLEFYT